MLWLQVTQDLLAPLDAASTRHVPGQPRAALATHQSSGGVFFDSRAWLLTARRPWHTLTPGTGINYAHATTVPPGRPARQPHDR